MTDKKKHKSTKNIKIGPANLDILEETDESEDDVEVLRMAGDGSPRKS